MAKSALASQHKSSPLGRSTRGSPSLELTLGLQATFDLINTQFFHNDPVPPCHLIVSPHSRGKGFFQNKAWVHHHNPDKHIGQIALSASDVTDEALPHVVLALAHEMVHAWQHKNGTAGRRGYHNRLFADTMESMGIITSVTGAPGGKRTGESVSQYIEPGGAFERFREEQISLPELFPWQPIVLNRIEDTRATYDTSPRHQTYRCRSCGAIVWGTPRLKITITCDDCGPFMRVPRDAAVR